MKKIILIALGYPPEVTSGPGRYAGNLAKELLKKGYYTCIITPKLDENAKPFEKHDKFEIHRLKIFDSKSIGKIIPNLLDMRLLFNRKLKKFFDGFDYEQYDLLHILDMHNSYFLTKKIAKKIPIVISANDYYSLEASLNPMHFPYISTDFVLRYLHYNLLKRLNKKYLPFADIIISDTLYTKKALEQNISIGKEKIVVVYKGVDLSEIPLQVPKDKYENHRLLYIGGNMERKGVKYILLALPQVLQRYPDTTLKIIGKCSIFYKQILRKIVKKYRLTDNVEFIERCKPQEVYGYMNDCNAFVMTPLIEDLAQVYLEAMATKTAVVCSDVGANSEGIIHKKTGLLVKKKDVKGISDAIISIFSDPIKAEEMGENGRKRVEEKFTSQQMVDHTLTQYHTIIDGRKNE